MERGENRDDRDGPGGSAERTTGHAAMIRAMPHDSAAYRLRATDRLPATADLVVIGAGVIGCATAFRAAQAGLRTVVIDARPRPATLTTPAATGAFRLQFDNAEEVALVREGVELYADFATRAGLPGYDIGLRQQGYLFCARDEDGSARQRELVARQHGFGLTDVELLDGDEVRRRFPFVGESVRSARFRAGDGFIDQVRLAWGYALAASGGPGVERSRPAPPRRPSSSASGSAACASSVAGSSRSRPMTARLPPHSSSSQPARSSAGRPRSPASTCRSPRPVARR